MAEIHVAIRRDDIGPRRVGKVSMLKDHGFAFFPAFKPDPHPGFWLGEVPADYSRAGRSQVGREQLFREYRSTGAVKLSVHGDGYVQLSRAGAGLLLSGRDNGRPRAFGYQSFAPTDPPRSGPSVGMMVWGLVGYPLPKPGVATMVFGPDELYLQHPDESIAREAYAVEFWFLPRYALMEACRHHDKLYVPGPVNHPYYASQPVEFAVHDFGHPLIVIGIVITQFHGGFSAPSGVSLGTMSDRTSTRVLAAIAPPPHAEALPSADYGDAYPRLPDAARLWTPPSWLPTNSKGRLWGRARLHGGREEVDGGGGRR